MKQFILIEGGRDGLEKLFQKLITEPESFSGGEFAHLIDTTFKDRLSWSDIVRLCEARLQRCNWDRLEQDTLLALLHGQDEEFERLTAILDQRNKLRLLVIRSEGGTGNEVLLGTTESGLSDDE